MTPDPRRWLSVEEAAEWTGTDPDWILAHIRSGALRKVETARRKRADGPGPRRYRIDRAKLDALMERLETGAPPKIPEEGPREKSKRLAAPVGEETIDEILARRGL
jgi:hypothetical protein